MSQKYLTSVVKIKQELRLLLYIMIFKGGEIRNHVLTADVKSKDRDVTLFSHQEPWPLELIES